MSIEIHLNGELTAIKSTTLLELLRELQLGDRQLAVELNRSIVPKTSYEVTKLQSGDELEIIHFVGGG